ncbi:MAG: T9SS type A sorting domain-containing protein [Ignavibacteriales bacterium]|nr:T9SS type A sorting domain-containing protein [Ignavibacteriales bacterium]
MLTVANNLTTGIGSGGYSEGNQLPAQMAIANYPNPFNPSTNIHFKVTERSPVGITIVNTLGEVVADFHQGILNPGEYTVRWDAVGTASGVYICVVNTGKRMLANKMLLKK